METKEPNDQTKVETIKSQQDEICVNSYSKYLPFETTLSHKTHVEELILRLQNGKDASFETLKPIKT